MKQKHLELASKTPQLGASFDSEQCSWRPLSSSLLLSLAWTMVWVDCQGWDGTATTYKMCQKRWGGSNGFGDEKFIHDVYLHTSGFQKAGYQYANMDASWNLVTRSPTGDLQPDPAFWPSGISKTVDYIYSLDRGFGLYGDRGEVLARC